jgi:hypothetical protein
MNALTLKRLAPRRVQRLSNIFPEVSMALKFTPATANHRPISGSSAHQPIRTRALWRAFRRQRRTGKGAIAARHATQLAKTGTQRRHQRLAEFFIFRYRRTGPSRARATNSAQSPPRFSPIAEHPAHGGILPRPERLQTRGVAQARAQHHHPIAKPSRPSRVRRTLHRVFLRPVRAAAWKTR